MNIINAIATNNPCCKAQKYISPSGLMLHSVGCPQPSAEVFAKNWNNANAKVCVHAVLQADGDVYQLLPWYYRAWHGGGSSNSTHIGVEMTEPDCIKYTEGATFTCSNYERARMQVRGTYQTAVELFAFLCNRYCLDPMTDICSHAEGYKKGIASNHGDPDHLWKQLGMEYTMDTFRAAVRDAMNKPVVEPIEPRVITVREWQKAAVLDGFTFPKHGTDGVWGAECESVASKAIVKQRDTYKYKNLTKLVQRAVGMTGKDVDGLCGSKTDAAIKAYQYKFGLELVVDGAVGLNTWKKILNI